MTGGRQLHVHCAPFTTAGCILLWLVAHCCVTHAQVIPVFLPPGLSADTSLADLTATEAVEQLCSRNCTAVQYATALLQRTSEWQCLNAVSAANVTQASPGFILLHPATCQVTT